MAAVNLGRVGLVLKGDWYGTTTYTALDVVSHDGNSWAAKRGNTNVEPTTENTDDWQLISNNSTLVATVQGYKEDAEAAATTATNYGNAVVSAVAPVEASSTASQAYAAGDFFIYNGTLYIASASIAQGGTITPDTNCTAIPKGISSEVTSLKSAVDDFSETVEGKNKYNPAACSPEDGKLYDGTTGAIKAGASYAATGKIPVEENTQYTFSSTTKAAEYARPYFYSGNTGGTYLSRGDQGATTFTTPSGCTFVAFNLFGRSHTTEDYNAAIAAAMLELGATATAYEAYFKKQMVVPSGIEGGSAIGVVQSVTGSSSPVNLFDKTLAVDGKYINNGSVVTLADWAYTGKIPVKPNTQYNISKSPTAPLDLKTSVQQWGADGSYIGSITATGGYSYLVPFVTGANTYYVSVNMSKTSHTTQDFNDTIDTIMLCYGTQRPLTYSAYNKQANVLSDKLDTAYFNPDVFSGKKWLACGTSITWYDSKTYSAGLHTGEICRGYVGNVARRKGLLVTNEGISGSCLAGSASSALINRYQSLDWANTDIATIEYGVNDFGNAIAIGTADDAAGTDTFAACLKTIIEYALTQNPKLCLVICTDPDVRGNTANSGGHYLYEYTDVTLAIAKQYRLPVCDWYYHSGINAVTKGSSSVDYLTADGTHPNDAGHLRMGAMLNQVFDSLIC